MNISQIQGPGNAGFRPKDEVVYLIAHAAITKNTVYTVDKSTATAATGGMATTSADATAGTAEGLMWVLAMDDIASGATGRFLLQGYHDVINDGTDLAADVALTSNGAGAVVLATAGTVIIGNNLEAVTATSGKCWFDGRGSTTIHA